MLHTRFKAESPVLKVGSCHGTQLKVTGLSALSRKPNLDKLGARPALRLATNQTLLILRTSDKDVRRISTLPPAQNYRRARFLSPLQSAGTARLFAQLRIEVFSSALVTLNGCVA